MLQSILNHTATQSESAICHLYPLETWRKPLVYDTFKENLFIGCILDLDIVKIDYATVIQ